MKHPSLQTLKNLKFAGLPSERLADYAYALSCCRFPASVGDGGLHQMVALICDRKIDGLRREIDRRLESEGDAPSLAFASQVCDDPATYYESAREYFSLPVNGRGGKRAVESFGRLLSRLDYSRLSDSELARLHALGPLWYDLRRSKEMEVFTREYFWRIANVMADATLAHIFLLTECLEADNYSHVVDLPYNMGERLTPFSPSSYPDDAALTGRIEALSRKRTYLSREELIGIAGYIQTAIVETGKTAEHLAPVNAILSTGMPGFRFPKIARGLEKATMSLAKSRERSQMELAPVYHTLWGITGKYTHLNQFEKILRHCYFTLANDKSYPGLGVDIEDSGSLASAISFLDSNRRTLWILSERYDVDKVIRKYRTTLGSQNQELRQEVKAR